MKKQFISLSLIAICLAAIFLSNPEIDLMAARLAFNEAGNHFHLSNDPILTVLHKSVRWITISFVLLFLSAALFYKFTGRTILDLTYRKLIFLVVVLAMGPGVLVNSVFKEHWGRARPHHVIEFGGTKEFSPPIVIADQCESNCSFVSGDAAVGFYFFALLFAFGKKYRRLLLPLAICTATTFSSIRVLQGAHFLSDVMFSGVITYFTILVAAHFILNRKDKKTP